MSQHLLMIEDDARLASMVSEYLSQNGFTVSHEGDGQSGLAALQATPDGCETLQLTDAGIAYLADARQNGLRALSSHDRLAQRFAEQHLLSSGRIVWR